MMAKIEPSTPREPPESSSGPLSSDRNRLSTRNARDIRTEDASLDEVPSEVDADHEPEPPRQDIGGSEQHARFDPDGCGSVQRRVGVSQVHEPAAIPNAAARAVHAPIPSTR